VTDLLPLFPLGTVLFPGMAIPMHVFEERYRRLLADRHQTNPAFGIVLLRSGRDTDSTGKQDVYSVGTAARILSRRRLGGGRYDLVVEGTSRFTIQSINWDLGYGLATVSWRDEPLGDPARAHAALARTAAAFDRYLNAVTTVATRPIEGLRMSSDPLSASYDLAARLTIPTWERQQLLEAEDAARRLALLGQLIAREHRLLVACGLIGISLDHPGPRFTLN